MTNYENLTTEQLRQLGRSTVLSCIQAHSSFVTALTDEMAGLMPPSVIEKITNIVTDVLRTIRPGIQRSTMSMVTATPGEFWKNVMCGGYEKQFKLIQEEAKKMIQASLDASMEDLRRELDEDLF